MLEPVTLACNRYDMRVMQQAIQQCRRQRRVLRKGRISLSKRQIARHHQTAFLVLSLFGIKEPVIFGI